MTSIPSHHIRKIALTSLLVAAVAAGACKGKHSPEAGVKNEEAQPVAQILSSLKMNDELAPAHLLKGFYVLENNAWRWTAGSFTVLLKPPVAAAQRGGVLSLSFSVPEIAITKLKNMTLTASIGTTKLTPATYNKPGRYTYTADVPAELLSKETVTIDFDLDHSLPPGSVDQRELGVIATAVGLDAK
jgi:hypothetical protein